jgi:hypothetical protein
MNSLRLITTALVVEIWFLKALLLVEISIRTLPERFPFDILGQ